MRFWTIWSIKMDAKERFYRLRDWVALQVAWRLPLRVRYWVTMHEIGAAVDGLNTHIPSITVDEVLRNLKHPEIAR